MAEKNARPRDARAGYTLFREAGGDISRPELNRRLIEAGYGPISARMMSHYQNLANANYDRYISINRFDVARAASRYEDLGASPRYRYTPVGEGVRLLIAKGNKLWTAAGQVTRIGEAGAIIRLVDEEYQEGLTAIKVRPGDFVSLRFLESGRSADGRIVEVDVETSPPLLEVQFTSLVSLADFAFGFRCGRHPWVFGFGRSMTMGHRLRTSLGDDCSSCSRSSTRSGTSPTTRANSPGVNRAGTPRRRWWSVCMSHRLRRPSSPSRNW